MTRPIFVVDAFASGPFRGNPAAVVLLEPGDEPAAEWMQAVAAEMKHSETAFVQPRADGDFDLRWFTPEVEVDLCGHATLASAHVLWESRAGSPRRGGAVPHPRRRAPGHARARRRGAARLPHRAARAVRRAGRAARRARHRRRPSRSRTTGQFFMLVVPDAATVRDLDARLRRAARAHRRARRLRDRGRRRRRARHRVALLRAARRHRRRPGHRLDALRARARTGANDSA